MDTETLSLEELIQKYENVEVDSEKIPTKEISEKMPKDLDKVYLFILNDLRIGSSFSNRKKFLRHLRIISELPNARVIVNGGLFDIAPVSEKAQNNVNKIRNVMTIQAQKNLLLKCLEIIQDKILVVTLSDDEKKIWNSEELNPYTEIIEKLKLQDKFAFESYSIDLTLSNGQILKIFGKHGKGRGGTIGSATKALEQLGKDKECCDVYCIGNFGENIVLRNLIENVDSKDEKTKLVDHEQFFIGTSGYLDYSENNMNARRPHNTDKWIYSFYSAPNPDYAFHRGKGTNVKSKQRIYMDQIDIDRINIQLKEELHNYRVEDVLEEFQNRQIDYFSKTLKEASDKILINNLSTIEKASLDSKHKTKEAPVKEIKTQSKNAQNVANILKKEQVKKISNRSGKDLGGKNE